MPGVSGATFGNDDHVRGVLDQNARIPVIRVIVVRSRRQHQVRLPEPDLSNDFFSRLERRQQLAVVIVQHDVVDTDAPSGFLCFGAATRGERATALGLMPGVAIRDRDEANAVPEGRQLRCRAAGLLVAIVLVRAERDDVELSVGRRRHRSARCRLLIVAGSGPHVKGETHDTRKSNG